MRRLAAMNQLHRLNPFSFTGFFQGDFPAAWFLTMLVIALLVFGPKKLPELGKGIGDGFRALKEGMRDKTSEQVSNPPSAPASTNTDIKS